jgi:hypothetical protein
MVPVLVRSPCDVVTVARSWDDLPVLATIVCGMSRRSQVCEMSFVFSINFPVGCQKRLRFARCAHILSGTATTSETWLTEMVVIFRSSRIIGSACNEDSYKHKVINPAEPHP